jgi:hypothetical protein
MKDAKYPTQKHATTQDSNEPSPFFKEQKIFSMDSTVTSS